MANKKDKEQLINRQSEAKTQAKSEPDSKEHELHREGVSR